MKSPGYFDGPFWFADRRCTFNENGHLSRCFRRNVPPLPSTPPPPPPPDVKNIGLKLKIRDASSGVASLCSVTRHCFSVDILRWENRSERGGDTAFLSLLSFVLALQREQRELCSPCVEGKSRLVSRNCYHRVESLRTIVQKPSKSFGVFAMMYARESATAK